MNAITSMKTDLNGWFDTMKTLAQEDPQAFEALRKEMVDEVINAAPESCQRRLIGLQWRIDQERRLAKSPMAACIRISEMMWDSVTSENGLLENLNKMSAFQR